MPGPPPMNSTAASRLVARKPIATGTPNIISPRAVPKSSVAAQYQAMRLGGDVGQRCEEILAPLEKSRELDRHHQKRQRDPAHHHPARHVERAHVLLVLHEVADRDLEAVP